MSVKTSGAESLRGFTVAIKNFSEKLLPQQIRAFQKYLAMKLFRLILQKTPVDTGSLRGSWTVSVGNPGSAEHSRALTGISTGQDALPEEIQQMQAMASQLESMPLGTKIWFSNTMPYVLRIEFGGHSSVKAPQGMVRVSIEEVRLWATTQTSGALAVRD